MMLEDISWQRGSQDKCPFPIWRLSPFQGKLASKVQVWGCVIEIKVTGMKGTPVLFHLAPAFAGAPIVSQHWL